MDDAGLAEGDVELEIVVAVVVVVVVDDDVVVTGDVEGDGVTGADEGREETGAEVIIFEQPEVMLTSFKTAMGEMNA